MLYAIISKRFHTCLQKEAQNVQKKAIYFSCSDHELVHEVCRHERLTLFNFLKMHLCDENLVKNSKIETTGLVTTLNEERIKDLIHSEYQFYFKHRYSN